MGAAIAALRRVEPLALVLGVAFGVLVALQPVDDSDLFWHVATGRSTIAGELPRTDLFSWTIAGGPVLADQWLGDALLAVARRLADWRGVLALRVLAVAALVTIVVDGAMRARRGRPTVAVAAALPAIALSRFAWTDRPELYALVCFALLVLLLRGGDRELLLSLPLLFVWSQLHGSYALGLALILASCLARAIESGRDRWRLVPIAAAAVLMTLLTPSGLAVWTSSGGHFLAPPRYIAEEGVPDARTLPGALFLLTLALAVGTAMTRPSARARDVALLVPVAFVALTAARHTPYLAIAAAPFFAERWPDPLGRWRGAGDELAMRPGETGRAIGRVALAALAGLALVGSVVLADRGVDHEGYPRSALAALPRGPGLLNQYDWGGYLIEFAPDTPVFIDGRLFPYVPEVLADYRAIVGARPGWEDVVARRGVTAILVRPGDAIAVRARERGWRVAYEDAVAVLLVR